MYVLVYPLYNSKAIKVPMSYVSRIKSGNLLTLIQRKKNWDKFKLDSWTFDFFPSHHV